MRFGTRGGPTRVNSTHQTGLMYRPKNGEDRPGGPGHDDALERARPVGRTGGDRASYNQFGGVAAELSSRIEFLLPVLRAAPRER
jgi:hypothetical protein